MSPSHPLHDLAVKIEKLTAEHPAYSQASLIVRNCVDHLQAVARVHEANVDSIKIMKVPQPNGVPCLSVRWQTDYMISENAHQTTLDVLVNGRHFAINFMTPYNVALTTPRLPAPMTNRWAEHLMPVPFFIQQLRGLADLVEQAV